MSLTPKNSFALLADADTLEIANHSNKDHYLKQRKSGGRDGGQKKEEVSRWYVNYKKRQEEEEASKQKQQLPEKSNFVVLGRSNGDSNGSNSKGGVEKSRSLVERWKQGKAAGSNFTGNNGKFSCGGGDERKVMAQGSDSKPFRYGYDSVPNGEGLSKQKAGMGYGKALKKDGVVEKEKTESPRFNFDDSAQFPGLG